MAKINIEIDGKNALLKIDNKEVENLSSSMVDFYKNNYGCDGTVDNFVGFSYSVKDKNNDEFPSLTTYFYEPSKASFGDGVKMVDVKHPTKADYGRMWHARGLSEDLHYS